MNWVCEYCGYENEYNDESQPTECLCCGEPANERLLNQARRALEKYHKEQEHQRRLELLRQEAIKRQEKIEHLVALFAKSMKGIVTACIVLVILAVTIMGFSIYKGNITPKYIEVNIKNIMVMDNLTFSTKASMEHLSGKVVDVKENISKNVGTIVKSKDYSLMDNLGILVEDKKEDMTSSSMMLKSLGDDIKVKYENRMSNIVVFQNKGTKVFGNFMNNCKQFWVQATKNIDQLMDYISMKIGRSK